MENVFTGRELREAIVPTMALESMPHLAALENGTLGGERRKKHIVVNFFMMIMVEISFFVGSISLVSHSAIDVTI